MDFTNVSLCSRNQNNWTSPHRETGSFWRDTRMEPGATPLKGDSIADIQESILMVGMKKLGRRVLSLHAFIFLSRT